MKIVCLLLFPLTIAAPLVLRAEPTPATTILPTADPGWTAIKDTTFKNRSDFAAGAGRLLEKLDGQIGALKAKRADLPETSAKDWDFAMKELEASRSYLQSMIEELGSATSETWDQAKERVAKAWQRAETACDKVVKSTTS